MWCCSCPHVPAYYAAVSALVYQTFHVCCIYSNHNNHGMIVSMFAHAHSAHAAAVKNPGAAAAYLSACAAQATACNCTSVCDTKMPQQRQLLKSRKVPIHTKKAKPGKGPAQLASASCSQRDTAASAWVPHKQPSRRMGVESVACGVPQARHGVNLCQCSVTSSQVACRFWQQNKGMATLHY